MNKVDLIILILIINSSENVITTRSKLRKVLFLALSMAFYLCMKHLWNRWTDLRQIHREGAFGPSLRRIRMSESKVKGQCHQGQKPAFSALSAACVWF